MEVIWRGRRVRAWVPAPLSVRDLALDVSASARVAAAAAELARAAEALDAGTEPLARLLLRAEGVASSYIEGVTAPVVDVVLAEADLGRPGPGPAAWVAANLAAMDAAVADATTGRPLTVDLLCAWHRVLMTGSPTPERHVGRPREEQGWIGGTSPFDAHLVTPPPDRVAALLDDLVAYANRADVDPVAQAAACHAQFEVVHPFADGNGRVGRLLVAWVLCRRLALLVPPPVSVAVAADVGGYGAGLVQFRLGDHLRWFRWFADAVTGGGRAQRALAARADEIAARWRAQLAGAEHGLRRDAAVFDALDVLPRKLVLTSRTLVEELGISRKAAVATLRRLAAAGILTPYGTVRRDAPGQPAALYVSPELLGLTGSSPLR